MANARNLEHYANSYNFAELVDTIEDYKDRSNYLANEVESLKQKVIGLEEIISELYTIASVKF